MTNPAQAASLSPPPDCKRCRNTRHVKTDKGYLRCDCMAEYMRGCEYTAAGISPLMFDPDLGIITRNAGLEKLVPALIKPLKAPVIFFYDCQRASSSRVAIPGIILRHAIDAGRSARQLGLDGCIQARFREEERPLLYRAFEQLDVLVLDLDVQNHHKLIPQVCMDIYQRRASRPVFTLFLAAGFPGKHVGLYGPEFASVFTSGRVKPLYGKVGG